VAALTELLGAVDVVVFGAPVVAVIVLLAARRRDRDLPDRERRWTTLLDLGVGLNLLAVAAVTLVPIDPARTGLERGVQLRPGASILTVATTSVDGSVVVRLLVLNVLLFVPLGMMLALRTRSLRHTLAVAALTSLAIEVAQALLPLGRTSNVDDVLLNVLGAAVGAGLVALVRRLRGQAQLGPTGARSPATRAPSSGRGDGSPRG
jgi:glycopeptide antibiotics resistance protein